MKRRGRNLNVDILRMVEKTVRISDPFRAGLSQDGKRGVRPKYQDRSVCFASLHRSYSGHRVSCHMPSVDVAGGFVQNKRFSDPPQESNGHQIIWPSGGATLVRLRDVAWWMRSMIEVSVDIGP